MCLPPGYPGKDHDTENQRHVRSRLGGAEGSGCGTHVFVCRGGSSGVKAYGVEHHVNMRQVAAAFMAVGAAFEDQGLEGCASRHVTSRPGRGRRHVEHRFRQQQLNRLERLLSEKWLKPRPHCGLDCLICTEVARQRLGAGHLRRGSKGWREICNG